MLISAPVGTRKATASLSAAIPLAIVTELLPANVIDRIEPRLHTRRIVRKRNRGRTDRERLGAVLVGEANAYLRSADRHAHPFSHGLIFDSQQWFVPSGVHRLRAGCPRGNPRSFAQPRSVGKRTEENIG